MRAQWELLGKYQGYGPLMRQVMQGPAPFIPWALSAARFVYWTMPAHRSALTSLLVKTQNSVQAEWDKAHADLSPAQASLRAAARTKDGGLIDFSRYTPYGLTVPAVEGNLQGVSGQMLPQLQGVLAAMQGQDPFGQPLRGRKTPSNPAGTVNPLSAAGYSFLESVVPYLSTIRRLREHGQTALGDSTVFSPDTKPGTSHGMSAFDRTFNPFRPVYIRGAKPSGQGKALSPVDQAVQAISGGASSSAIDQALKAIGGG